MKRSSEFYDQSEAIKQAKVAEDIDIVLTRFQSVPRQLQPLLRDVELGIHRAALDLRRGTITWQQADGRLADAVRTTRRLVYADQVDHA